ncbi:MAG TPA: TetR/AcrR family transcriptional regulator [Ilumatobacter sp.]|nr:TetR/AcrR family transcriptional regulator [Ilumatobacter sp.]
MAAVATIDASPDSGRARIMDEAATSFLHHGYPATSLRQIATAVGMKAGSIYYHFASKEELLTAILQRGISVMQAAFDDAERTAPTNPAAARVEAHVRAHLAALFENGPYTAAHVMTFRTAPAAVREAIVPVRDAYEARWTELLARMQSDGLIAAGVDVHVARLILFGAMNSTVEWFDPGRGNLDRFAAAITQQFWNGVAA